MEHSTQPAAAVVVAAIAVPAAWLHTGQLAAAAAERLPAAVAIGASAAVGRQDGGRQRKETFQRLLLVDQPVEKAVEMKEKKEFLPSSSELTSEMAERGRSV